MIQSKHCKLCKHEKRSLENGLTCGLTKKRPDFENACDTIEFSKPFKEELIFLLNEIESYQRKSKLIHFNFYLKIGIGFAILFFGKSLLNNILAYREYRLSLYESLGIEDLYFFRESLLVYIVGLFILFFAYKKLNSYRKRLKKLNSDKREIELVLNNYNSSIEVIIN